ncbi:MAG: alpha/beta hydrolase [Pirellulaceae bacterium]
MLFLFVVGGRGRHMHPAAQSDSCAASTAREGTRRSPWRRVWTVLRAAAIAYLLLLLIIMWLEKTLIFPTWTIPPGDWHPEGLSSEDVFFTSSDGTRLHGWYFDRPGATVHVLYCHGNGEDVAALGPYMDVVRARHDVAVFAFDFRGYGRSEGRPEERGVVEDARAAQRWLAQRAGVATSEIVLWGRSIGGAMAVQLAVDPGARGLILERTFTSLPAVAACHYPWLPVRWLMHNRFDSLARIGAYRGPLLQSHGTADEVVPFAQGKQLFEAAAASPKQFVAMQAVTHNGPNDEEYYTELQVFLDRLRSPGNLPVPRPASD